MGAVIEAITANGAVRVANTDSTESQQNTGKALLKAALILQLALMAGFVALAAKFHYNCSRAGVLNGKVRRALYVLYCSCTLITVRTIYRTVEYFTAASLNITDVEDISPILKDEWFFWVFETAVMLSNTAMMNVFHPMRSLPRSNKVYLATDGVTEVEGPGFKDRRPFILTLVDPFDIVGIFCKTKGQEKYWENDGVQNDTRTGKTTSQLNQEQV